MRNLKSKKICKMSDAELEEYSFLNVGMRKSASLEAGTLYRRDKENRDNSLKERNEVSKSISKKRKAIKAAEKAERQRIFDDHVAELKIMAAEFVLLIIKHFFWKFHAINQSYEQAKSNTRIRLLQQEQ